MDNLTSLEFKLETSDISNSTFALKLLCPNLYGRWSYANQCITLLLAMCFSFLKSAVEMESSELELYSNSPGFLTCPNTGGNSFPTNCFSLIKIFNLLKGNSFPEERQKKKGLQRRQNEQSSKIEHKFVGKFGKTC